MTAYLISGDNVFLTPMGAPPAGVSPVEQYGMEIANDASYLAGGVAVSAGLRLAVGSQAPIVLLAGIAKRLVSPWQPGNGGSGLDTGSALPNATYFAHAIGNAAGGADVLLSASPHAPVMPSGWTARKRLGAVMTDGAGAIYHFRQCDGWFHFMDGAACVVGRAIGPAAQSIQLRVPFGIKVQAEMTVQAYGAPNTVFSMCDQDRGDAKLYDCVGVFHAASTMIPCFQCMTDAAARVNVWAQNAGYMDVFIRGWFDFRDG